MQLRGNGSDTKARVNRLFGESSPYLLQHAHNPVEWYPWGEESLQKAKNENRPIFLSIGYSACHWCHVMAHESFEDEEIASIMNENFINIKVDREERPDIDDVYQRVSQLAMGTGGWPLSVFLTPDQKPFYVGTYFPKYARHGMPGFGTILTQLAEAYKTKKREIDSATVEFLQALGNSAKDVQQPYGVMLDRSILDEAAVGLLHLSDPVYGGFGQAPKFPNPSNLLFLLRCYDISGLHRYKDFVMFTADKMAAGGIHDQIGGGFARYSTDQKWLVPHFEKMLYDNALLVQVYAELYQISGDEKYLDVVEKTLEYVRREMLSPENAFYSAQDADSEGEEGKFYVWSKQEILNTLGDETIARIFCDYYGVGEAGNFEGKNILNIRSSFTDLSLKYNRPPGMLKRVINDASSRLFEIREKRIKPGRDDKVLTAWNGLMISGFAKGFRVTNNRDYLEIAKNAIEFVESKVTRDNGRLYRTFKDGISKLNAYLDDYAFFVNALLDVFEIDSNPIYLDKAIKYTDFMLQHFWDPADGNLYFTSDDHEQLIVRTKSLYDLAIPSGNSVAAYNLLRLYHLTQKNDYLEKAEQIMKAGATSSAENPFGFGQLLMAIYLYVKKPIEIRVRTTDDIGEGQKMARWINKQFMPNAITVINENQSQISKLQEYPFFSGTNSSRADAADYAVICRNFTCSVPIYSLTGLQEHIKSVQ
ncbi:MAG TPA: thioredoxin domain-containing protein [Candidatus Nitrosopolaris sp.]|nr:thioredoxin domain-containing protein [Candidatus Nitrosopolaris sp.]